MRSENLSVGLMMVVLVALAVFGTTTRAGAQQEKVLYGFSANNGDGQEPWASLIFDAAGNLYGTTAYGGAYNGGTVFELSPLPSGGWSKKLLHAFNPNFKDGLAPYAGVIVDQAGNLYGTTTQGGTHNQGTAFELIPTAGGKWTEKILHNFDRNGIDGSYPYGGLIFDTAGSLYGTTEAGGKYNYGTVFELSPSVGGRWSQKILHNFFADGTDGFYSYAGLTLDAAGNLCGTTSSGGSHFTGGVVFELSPQPGGNWTQKILYAFNPSSQDGFVPDAGVVFDALGNLYGTTNEGGAGANCGSYGCGTVFELTPADGGGWTETIVHNFNGYPVDGDRPYGGVVVDATGNLYGTTPDGGIYNPPGGVVFELRRANDGGWTEAILHNFYPDGGDASFSLAGLILDASGNLYGTTETGGPHGAGTVFEIKR